MLVAAGQGQVNAGEAVALGTRELLFVALKTFSRQIMIIYACPPHNEHCWLTRIAQASCFGPQLGCLLHTALAISYGLYYGPYSYHLLFLFLTIVHDTL